MLTTKELRTLLSLCCRYFHRFCGQKVKMLEIGVQVRTPGMMQHALHNVLNHHHPQSRLLSRVHGRLPPAR